MDFVLLHFYVSFFFKKRYERFCFLHYSDAQISQTEETLRGRDRSEHLVQSGGRKQSNTEKNLSKRP